MNNYPKTKNESIESDDIHRVRYLGQRVELPDSNINSNINTPLNSVETETIETESPITIEFTTNPQPNYDKTVTTQPSSSSINTMEEIYVTTTNILEGTLPGNKFETSEHVNITCFISSSVNVVKTLPTDLIGRFKLK
ncbi:hypothetical protein BLOT_015600 [Blomia tropicalis]|nr:hypothetical protein BLOT_015600 [Blomia tropicalis]